MLANVRGDTKGERDFGESIVHACTNSDCCMENSGFRSPPVVVQACTDSWGMSGVLAFFLERRLSVINADDGVVQGQANHGGNRTQSG